MQPVPYQPPVPLAPSPVVSSPPEARSPSGFVPADPAQLPAPETPVEAIIDRAPRWLPGALAETLFAGTKLLNKVVFRAKGTPGEAVPYTPGSWKFSAIGDYGSGQRQLTDVTGNLAKGNPELVVTMGDNVYYDGTEDEYRRNWDPDSAFGSIRRNFPVMPSLGNHDTRTSADPYFRRFPELDGARYYSFTNKGVYFAALDTNQSLAPDSPQWKWLDRDMAASDAKFRVLYFHHPMFTGYPKAGSLQGYLAPLIARHGVELVLSGHEHNYSRSRPFTAGGATEIIAGGGGHTVHPFIGKQHDFTAWRDVDFGHVEVEVRDDALVSRYVTRNGEVRDTQVLRDALPQGGSGPADAAAGASTTADAAAPVAAP